jgi:hypothetical protein
MIVVRLMGGLGNQMFQYAAAYACAARLGVSLGADIGAYTLSDVHQGFELNRIFDLPLRVVDGAELANFTARLREGKVRTAISRGLFSKFKSRRLAVEPHFCYWPDIIHIGDGSCMEGYWQSEKYFEDVEFSLRKLFEFKLDPGHENSMISNAMHKENSVSVHVRRGDYWSDPESTPTHAVDLKHYYQAAISHACKHVPNPVFYVFSDDCDWVARNIDLLKSSRLIDHNLGKDSYLDMWLMSKCKHHIISNSTFGWWGAWLNDSVGKIVICPRQWFTPEATKILDPRDIYPKNAVLI